MKNEKNRKVRAARRAVTERDVEIGRWLGRHRLATAEQVMRRFGLQRSKAYERLAVLVHAGLVRYEAGVRSRRVYLATVGGLAATGLDLPRATVSAASFAHDLALVDVAIPFEHAGQRVLTERELRRPNATSKPFRLDALGDDVRGQWPDLVVLDVARRTATAIEVELSLKKTERIRDKLIAYQRTPPFDGVRYICGSATIARSVQREANRIGMRKITVELIGEVDEPAKIRPETIITQLRDELELERRAREHALLRAEQAESIASSERDAGFRLVDQIAAYVAADRSERRTILERWSRLAHRAARAPK